MAAETAGGDLPVKIKDRDSSVGLCPALCQVGLEGVEFAGQLALAALDRVLPAAGSCVPLDGVSPPAQVTGDVAQTHALGEEVVDERVVGAGPFGELAGRIICFVALAGGRLDRRLPFGLGFRTGRRKPVQARAVGGDGFLDRDGQVLPEMEPVGALESLGCGGGGCVGVGAGAVTADDLDAGMGQQPWGKSGGVTFGQQVEDLVGLGIDHDGSVDVTAPQSEVVHADGTRFRGGRIGQVHHAAQQGGAAGGNPHHLGEASASPAGQCQTDGAHGLPQSFGDPAVAAGQPRYLFDERPPTAFRGRAQEPPDL